MVFEEKYSYTYEILKNPPIIEAIFEIRWKVWEKGKPTIEPIDKKYKFFPGIFHEKIKNLFPYIEILPSTRIPDEMDIYLPRYRFRKTQNGYPLVQIGPGILTVNSDKNFTQELFHNTCMEVIDILYEIMHDIEIVHIQIHYIDGFDYDYDTKDAFEFLGNKLETSFNFSPELFEITNITPKPAKFHIESTYRVNDPLGYFMCQLRSGIRKLNNNKLILMDTIFRASDNEVPKRKEILGWIRKADDLIHKWFYKMISKMEELFK